MPAGADVLVLKVKSSDKSTRRVITDRAAGRRVESVVDADGTRTLDNTDLRTKRCLSLVTLPESPAVLIELVDDEIVDETSLPAVRPLTEAVITIDRQLISGGTRSWTPPALRQPPPPPEVAPPPVERLLTMVVTRLSPECLHRDVKAGGVEVHSQSSPDGGHLIQKWRNKNLVEVLELDRRGGGKRILVEDDREALRILIPPSAPDAAPCCTIR